MSMLSYCFNHLAQVLVLFSTFKHLVSSLSNSKLSIHSGMGSMSFEFIQQAQPRILKILDSFGEDVTQAKQDNPDMLIIGRIYLDDQPMTGDPNSAAVNWWYENNATILANPGIDFWEGYNECVGPDDLSAMQWYNEFEIARVDILAQNNLKACIGNFATGTPDLTNTSDMWPAFYGAIDEAIKYDGILGVHEYSSPWLTTYYDNTTNYGWLTGRYRQVYEQYLIPTNRIIKLAITEMGIDGGTSSNPTGITGGWQNFESYWASNGGNPDGPTEYTLQLEWYDNIMLQDDYVLGATIYCLEIPGWDSFQLTQPALDDITAYMNSV